MGLLSVTGFPNVDAMLGQASSDAYDGGCYRGISPQEFAGLQERVRSFSATEHDALDRLAAFKTGDVGGAYRDVIDSLRNNETYDQFVQRQARQPAADFARPESCDLLS